MNLVEIFTAILTLAAGIGVFLVACQMMSTNLESASSKRLKSLFSRAGESRWLGVGIGALGTAAIQSSGAVTVMVIGFVNVGIMSLAQAATIIYGANIGTTITAQLVALGMFGTSSISTTLIFSAFAGIGAFIMLFTKRDMLKQLGGVICGFGMLFVGLIMMQQAMQDFAELDAVKSFLAGISNAILLVLIGAIFTAIIQSSSVMTSIAITMVVTGLVSLDQGIYLTMGSNIGSCVVALLAGMTSGTNAKRTSMIHLLFNVMGVVIFLLIALLIYLFSKGTWSFGRLAEVFFPHAPQVQLAMFHTLFNTATMLLALPLTNTLVNLVCRMVPDKQTDESSPLRLYFLSEQMLSTPVVAIRQLKAEIENMAKMAIDNYNRAITIVTTMNFEEVEIFRQTEDELDFLNKELVRYAVMLSSKRLSIYDHRYLSTTIRTVSDLERIGDYAENIIEYAQTLNSQSATFSDNAIGEIKQMSKMINELYKEAMLAYHKADFAALGRANQIEDEIDDFTDRMENNHIQRLSLGVCEPNAGTEYISLAQNSERVADHLINVAKTIRTL